MPKRILIAEDDPLSRKSFGTRLRDIGYEVDLASDGAAALELPDNSPFNLVLSDIRMPRVDGITVISHLRSLSPSAPVTVLAHTRGSGEPRQNAEVGLDE
jgi:CheY-like chemotaxis protein